MGSNSSDKIASVLIVTLARNKRLKQELDRHQILTSMVIVRVGNRFIIDNHILDQKIIRSQTNYEHICVNLFTTSKILIGVLARSPQYNVFPQGLQNNKAHVYSESETSPWLLCRVVQLRVKVSGMACLYKRSLLFCQLDLSFKLVFSKCYSNYYVLEMHNNSDGTFGKPFLWNEHHRVISDEQFPGTRRCETIIDVSIFWLVPLMGRYPQPNFDVLLRKVAIQNSSSPAADGVSY